MPLPRTSSPTTVAPAGARRGARPLLGAALALAALGLVPAGAGAKTITAHNIVSPTKQISCYEVRGATKTSNAIECMAPYLPSMEGDGYIGLGLRGASRLGQRGDYPGYGGGRKTLNYGDTWKPRAAGTGITCTMRESGLTCTNRSSRGFRMARGDVRRF